MKKSKEELSEIAKKAVATRRQNDPSWGIKSDSICNNCNHSKINHIGPKIVAPGNPLNQCKGSKECTCTNFEIN